MNTSAHFPQSDPIAALWAVARAWIADARAAFGGPARIARLLTRASLAAVRRRLAILDAFAAKLLLVEAVRLGLPAPSRQAAARANAPRKSVHAPEDPARPETWRVRYRVRLGAGAPREPRATPTASLRAATHARARALARRFEALARVIADPRRAAQALARRLAQLGARARVAAFRLARRTPDGAAGMEFAHALVHACDAARAVARDTS